MTQINLHDDIFLDFSQKTMNVCCDHPQVPEDSSNIAYKAADRFFKQLKSRGVDHCKGISIKIVKRIPPGGGLGGGSSNAAAVLKALNNHYEKPFSKSQLMEIGLDLGADVPFFLFNMPAIAEGVGEKLKKIEILRPYHLVLCDPGVHASTAEVYKNSDFKLTTDHKYNIKNGLSILLRGNKFDMQDIMHNDLERSACRLYPEIRETKEEMELLLQKKVFMTGSGSSLFALFSKYENACKGFDKVLKKSSKKIFLTSFRQCS